MKGYLYLLIMLVLTTTGQLLTKKGADILSFQGSFRSSIAQWFNRYLLLAAVTVASAPAFYILALRELDLSVAFAFTGLNYIFVCLGGKILFKEKLDGYQYFGILLIVFGVGIFNVP